MTEKNKKTKYEKEDLKDPNKREGSRPRVRDGINDSEIKGNTSSDAMRKRVKKQMEKTMDAAYVDYGDKGKAGMSKIADISKVAKKDQKRDLDLIKQYGEDAGKARSYRSSKFDGDMKAATNKAKTGSPTPNPQFFDKDKLKGGGKVKKGMAMGGKMKKGMAMGGKMAKGMAAGGLKPAPNKGAASLPKDVRNNMGFMNKGGKLKKGMAMGGKMKKGYANGGKTKPKVRGAGIATKGVRPAKMR